MTTADAPIGTSKALREAFRLSPALRKGIWVTLGVGFLSNVMQLVVPVAIQQIIDRQVLAPGGPDPAAVAAMSGAAIAALVIGAVARRSVIIRLSTSSALGLNEIRIKTFAHLHRLSVLHTQAERRGALVSRVTTDITTIQDFMDWAGLSLITGAAQLLLAVIAMFIYNWQLATLVLVSLIIYGAMMFWFQRILQRANDAVRVKVANSMSRLGEAISGLPVVRAYGAEAAAMSRVDSAFEDQFAAEYRTAKLGSTLFSTAELYSGIITAAVVVVGLLLGQANGVTSGVLVAFLFLVAMLVQPVQGLVESLEISQAAGAGLRRIQRIIATEVEMPDPVDGERIDADGALEVRFDGVRFRYPTGPDVLVDVDVHITPGSRVAIVGETGSGKTTFAKLAARLLAPADGRISIGGVAIDRVPFESLRSTVGYVPQEGFLFDMTIADNVRYGRPGASDTAVLQAFADLGLDTWLETMPDGIETNVGESGGQLSAGERQLVALARAWIADPQLLVLDEATSSVDPALEVSLRRAIERLASGRTSLTVAHRLSTAEASDEILVFAEGRLVERGPHDDLLRSGGVYAALHADWVAGTTN